LDLWQLQPIDPNVTIADQFGALAEMQHSGVVRRGLRYVTVAQIDAAASQFDVACVQSRSHIIGKGRSRDVETLRIAVTVGCPQRRTSMTTTLTVDGMTCSSCVSHVKQALAIDGINAVDIRLADHTVTIDHEPRVTTEELRAILDRAGYASVAPRTLPRTLSERGCCCAGRAGN